MAAAEENKSGAVVVGHSWVTRLRKSGLLDSGFVKFVDLPGGTFPRLTELLGKEEACQRFDYVFVFLGGNDLDNAWGLGEVCGVMKDCDTFLDQLRVVFPNAKFVVAQVEERFEKGTLEADLDFRRKSNKFNKWLNKSPKKDKIFHLRGGKNFGVPIWYLEDGVHLNQVGTLRLALQLNGYFEDRRAH